MPSHVNSTAFCSCLTTKTHGGFTHFDIEAVVECMLELFSHSVVDFAAMSFDMFKPYYRHATNSMFKASSYYLDLPATEQAQLETWLEKRCAGCGYHAYRRFRECHTIKEAA